MPIRKKTQLATRRSSSWLSSGSRDAEGSRVSEGIESDRLTCVWHRPAVHEPATATARHPRRRWLSDWHFASVFFGLIRPTHQPGIARLGFVPLQEHGNAVVHVPVVDQQVSVAVEFERDRRGSLHAIQIGLERFDRDEGEQVAPDHFAELLVVD